jgi:CheY-like chemotaxis protein
MASALALIKINPDDVHPDEPIPYDIFTITGALLIGKNQPVSFPEQIPIIKSHGWRKPQTDEEKAQVQSGQDAKVQRYDWLNNAASVEEEIVLPDEGLRLPSRGYPPLEEAEALIAEDVRLARRLLTHMLSEQGVKKVEFVENGRDAIHYFFHHRPHMVFLDIDMPNMNGLEVLRQIKLWSPGNFACMVSGHGTMTNAREAKNYGVDGFLIKPINLVNLKRVLAMYTKLGNTG